MNLEHFGLSEMNLPEIAGNYSGKLLIVAGGRCVWDDIAELGIAVPCKHGQRGIQWDGDTMAVNDIGMHFPYPLTHWYSNDGVILPSWHLARRPEYKRFNENIQLHSFMDKPGLHLWPWPGHGGSGLNSVYTGLGLGYDEITIAGMPSDDSGHYFDPPWIGTNFTREVASQKTHPVNRWWKNAINHVFKGRVRAVSGRTMEWLK